jgi:hypothetical protein
VSTPGGPFDQAVAAELAKLKQDAEDLADALFAPFLDLLRDPDFRGFDFLSDDGDESL